MKSLASLSAHSFLVFAGIGDVNSCIQDEGSPREMYVLDSKDGVKPFKYHKIQIPNMDHGATALGICPEGFILLWYSISPQCPHSSLWNGNAYSLPFYAGSG